MKPVLFSLLLVATPALAQSGDRERYAACIAESRTASAAARESAQRWIANGGGAPARHCLAMAYLAEGRFAAASLALEQAGDAADAARQPAAADLYGQAGNAAILGGEFARAHKLLSAALVRASGDARRQAPLLIDRARASVELGKPLDARADLDRAVLAQPGDPAGWLLRATLRRKGGDLVGATTDIGEALKRAPQDPDVLLEAGNIAGLGGDDATAKAHWQAAAKAAPGTPAAEAATKALAANGG